jgi:hypothetical protein
MRLVACRHTHGSREITTLPAGQRPLRQNPGEYVDPTGLQDVAAALWPLLGTGAGERLGAAGTEHALQLIERIRARRREAGLNADPVSRGELEEELRLLPPSAEASIRVVYTEFRGEVHFHDRVNFGFDSGN